MTGYGFLLAALGLLGGCVPSNWGDHPDPPFSEDRGVVILFSGLSLMPGVDAVWNSGMTSAAQEIRDAGVPAEIYTPQEWEKASQYVETLPNARHLPVAIIGYSLGAHAGTQLAKALKDAGIPVQTLVVLDPFDAIPVSCNVSYALDVHSDVLRVLTGSFEAESDFTGTMEDWTYHLPDPVFHFTVVVDKDIRALVLKNILDGAGVRRRPPPAGVSGCMPNAFPVDAKNK
jgi:pimeloyl-ACP methyl ester carboxylesterase